MEQQPNEVILQVKLIFADPVDKKHWQGIAGNLADAIVHQVNTAYGIAPDEAETFTTNLQISGDGITTINGEL